MSLSITQQLHNAVGKALAQIAPDIQDPEISFEHPVELVHGDYATNVAMRYAKQLGVAPVILAGQIVAELNKDLPDTIVSVSVAGPGFINFTLSPLFFQQSLAEIQEQGSDFGKNSILAGKKIMLEFTDPNPFKQFHIGHLMSNAHGETLSRLREYAGANVVRSNYQGDIGPHVAKAIWAMQRAITNLPKDTDSLSVKTNFLGSCYVTGSEASKDDDAVQNEINEINKKLFEKSDPVLNELYAKGRQWSLDHFEEIYGKLGTAFQHYFFESEVWESGKKYVLEFLEKGVFERSDGAIIFPGEKYGLHTRVFITSLDLPLYETKEIGLNTKKFHVEPNLDLSIVMTANEQDSYFKVVLKALEFIAPEVAEKTLHMSHGMMRFADSKMSSRLGNVITGESLLYNMEEIALEKMQDRPETLDKKTLASQIAVAAIKYAILKQEPKKNIVFDPEKSLSFEGDSGPYLQYTYARCRSLIEKASGEGMVPDTQAPENWDITDVEKIAYRFPEIIEEALREHSSHYVATYLIELARAFNSFYGNTQIIEAENQQASQYKLAIVASVATVLHNGLWVLGISAPERM